MSMNQQLSSKKPQSDLLGSGGGGSAATATVLDSNTACWVDQQAARYPQDPKLSSGVFPQRKIQSSNPQQNFVSQQMADIAMKKQRQQAQQNQQQYGGNSYVSTTPIPTSIQELSQRSTKDGGGYGGGPQINTQASTQNVGNPDLLNIGQNSHSENAKFRVQGLHHQQPGYPIGTVGQSSQLNTGGPISSNQNEHRSFKGTGNQIAAMSHLQKAHSSTLGMIGQTHQHHQTNQQHHQIQPPQWIGSMTRGGKNTTTTAMTQGPRQSQLPTTQQVFPHVTDTVDGNHNHNQPTMVISGQNQPQQQLKQTSIRSQLATHQKHDGQEHLMASGGHPNLSDSKRIISNANVTNSAGRKTRVKSSRKRRFSSSSTNANQQKATTAEQVAGGVGGAQASQITSQFAKRQEVHKNYEGVKSGGSGTGDSMVKAAAQIIRCNGETIGSQNMGTMSAAYSSNGELTNLKKIDNAKDRFQSRQQKKNVMSTTTGYTGSEHLYKQMQREIAENSGGDTFKSNVNGEPFGGAHYGGGTLTGAATGIMQSASSKKYSHSVTRRNHGAIQDSGIGKNNLEMESQESSKNFNSLRNSRSLQKKNSAAATKKGKKLKKSESQARHQQLPKSELMTQQMMRLPDEADINIQSQQHHNQGTNKNQRGQNRTPQSFVLNEKIGGTGSHQARNGRAEIVKGSTTGSIQVSTNNLTELTKNTMHIKKINFTGKGMQSHPTQPVIQNSVQQPQQTQQQQTSGGMRLTSTNNNLEPLQQLQMALNFQAKEIPGLQQTINPPGGQKLPGSDRQQLAVGAQAPSTGNFNPSQTIESMIRQTTQPGQSSFNEFKSMFGSNLNVTSGNGNGNGNMANNTTTKPYKLMKSAERGEINTHNLVICNAHDKNGNPIPSKSPCTCNRAQAVNAANQTGFQSKASQNFQKTFRQGNFVYHGSRRSNDFNTIQTAGGAKPYPPGQQSPFTQHSQNPSQYSNLPQGQPPQQPIAPHISQGTKREDINKFGGNFQTAGQQAASQAATAQAAGQNPAGGPLNPLMSDLLSYLQTAYQNQQESIGSANTISSEQIKQRLIKQSEQNVTKQQEAATALTSASATTNGGPFQPRNKLIHFEKGDRIIYEPNEMHQLKYINEKGDVSPITGVQYILTQPNFSKGRPCHFFVVNKQEFEAATKGFKQKQDDQAKAEEQAKQRKMQAIANIRSHRASQKIKTQSNAKGRRQAERKQSAKGGRDGALPKGVVAGQTQGKEEEKKNEKAKYHNEMYTYQKLRSLKWMNGAYKNPNDDPAPIWRPSAEEQELRQQLEAKREIKAKYNLLSLNKQDATELYKYVLMLGNNHDVVKKVMDSRQSWVQIKSSQTLFNFKWAPSSKQIKFDFLGKHGQKHLVNHFENHHLITSKDLLLDSMSKMCENLHVDVFNSIPITFAIDLGTTLCQHEFDKFNYYFNMVEKHKEQYNAGRDAEAKAEILSTMNKNLSTHYNLSEKKRKYASVVMRETLFDGGNIWLFKPNDMNRGRGVNLFNSVEQLKKLIVDHTSRAETKQFQNFAHANNMQTAAQTVGGTNGASPENPKRVQLQNMNASGPILAEEPSTPGNNPANQSAQQQPSQPGAIHSNVKSDVFVLQKYIEKPLLINKRKFDIRLWVMVTAEHKCYLFKEGYIRMSGQVYDLSQTDNLFVHLTNNAIQKHDTNYNKFEEGNILSFKEGTDYLKKTEDRDVDFYQILRDDILPVIEQTLMSVRQKINKNNRKYCMEIFGYDFMIDEQLMPWLIEVNVNPCLEESNKLLRQLVPRMLDDAFKLTLDVMFPPLTPAKMLEALGDEFDPNHKQSSYPVDGYTDNENLWGDQAFYILRVPGAVVIQGS